MNSLSIEDNINNLLNIKQQLEKEILKVEGSLKVYEEMKKMGILQIQLPSQQPKEFELENTEVIDADDDTTNVVSD